MQWISTFLRGGSDMFRGVEGYFAGRGVELGGPLTPVVVDQATPTQVTLRDFGNLGAITFTGTGLTVQTATTPGGVGSIPLLTGGTITGMTVRFNDALDDLINALALANTAAERARIQAQIQIVQNDPAQLKPNAIVTIPEGMSAAALGQSILASYQARSGDPGRAFLSQFNHASTALVPGADILGFDGADVLTGGPGFNTIFGFGGNDTLDGGDGTNILSGGPGSDLYLAGAGADQITDDGPISDRDIVSYANAPAGLVADLEFSDGNQGTGYAAGDQMGGIEGLIGTRFDDTLIGRSLVQGPLSSDYLEGGAGNDTILGGDGSDTLVGGQGFDVLIGGPNRNTVGDLGPGDLAVFAAGPNEVHFFNSAQGLLVVTPRGGVDLLREVEFLSFNGQVFGLNQLTLSNANLRIGGTGGDRQTGTNGVDLLFGAAGNDTLEGGGANDQLDGGAGNDSLSGDAGRDTLLGGDGADTITGGADADLILGGETIDDLRDVIFGGAGNDTIDGGHGNDELRGDAGNDSIAGGFGADTVIGGTGNDTLTGSAFGDVIFGGDGMDFVNGGFGSDRVNGGANADTFFHLGVRDHGSDWIQDYNAAQGDVLAYGGNATRAQFQINTTTTPTAGAGDVAEAFVIYRPTGQILWALVDGDGQDQINLRLNGQIFDLTG
ncbi:calcium-binding protein [Jannaschia sp. M317]|uniref:calcium-binding protein n=1 Tax=Jannaschia sp. M317 TaxID=2867011 RepID=UPI0021A8972A|nr:calcium-binding protein [Jannaschia sp. M317]UWQ19646.1 hypothetical protein K3551_18290 [Jannaschia sp. M317]